MGITLSDPAVFQPISETLAEHILLIMCKRDGRYVAGALNFIGGDTLFGRNWGCIEHHPFLHFETCYYQAIDFAIERGLKKVEAGAQGEPQGRPRLPATGHLQRALDLRRRSSGRRTPLSRRRAPLRG